MPKFLLPLAFVFTAAVAEAQDAQTASLQELNRDVWTPFVHGVSNYDDDAYLDTRSKDFVMVQGKGGGFLDYDYYVEDSVQVMKGLRESGVKLAPQIRFEERYSNGEHASELGLMRMSSTDAQGKETVGITRFHAISRKEADGHWRVLTEYRWRDKADTQATFDAAKAPDDLAAFPSKKAANG